MEYEAVLKRLEQREVSGLSLSEIDRALGSFSTVIEPVEIRYAWRPQLRDPNDEIVLEAAINGRADAIVTFNVRDFAEAAPRFAIRVLRPVELLRELVP